MPHIRIVASSALDASDLRATTYVRAPKRAAQHVVDTWVKAHPILNRNSRAVKELERFIEAAIIHEIEKQPHH